MRVNGVGDRKGVEDEYVPHVERRLFFAQTEADAVFRNLGRPHDVALADSGIVRMRTQRARSRGRRIRPQHAVESYEGERAPVDSPVCRYKPAHH